MIKEKLKDMYYESPLIEVIDVEVEKGFFVSSENEDYGNMEGNW